MSSSSDSEDECIKLVLEAADTSLLTDALFNFKKDEVILPSDEIPKSQRQLQGDDHNCIDFIPPEGVQKQMSKKLANLVKEQVEFITNIDVTSEKRKRKSRVKLLNDFECYVKPYEEFEFEEPGPLKKPTIKRRDVDKEIELDEESMLKSAAIDGESILSGKETMSWSKRSKGDVFRYKIGGNGSKQHYLIEPENEFTKLRRKNKWNESKIKTATFATK